MSSINTNTEQELSFYLSSSQPCPYIEGREERKLFTRLSGKSDKQINAMLCQAGFRRSHDVVYRPACGSCVACVPVRILAPYFAPTKTMERTAAKNKNLSWIKTETASTPELFKLFCDYQAARHCGEEMAKMDEAAFAAMLQDGKNCAELFILRDDEKIKGCMISDDADDGLSAVYSFFDTENPQESLGTELIMRLVQEAVSRSLPFVYLGYLVERSRKMSYKARFKPLQMLTPSGWTEF